MDGQGWTQEKVATMAKQWLAGVPTAEIAEACRKSPGAVENKAWRLNLPTRRWHRTQHETARVRPCICCEQSFHSEWIGNRLCGSCATQH